ncbi:MULTISPECIES: lytic transglycosylase domain-containing protein [Galbibacter]|uniref:LysM peptidoglycan-binding domain-containing protein n=1 Tax=Galbibacter pacificus TaxID=2996052 RepID=A0ABT6FU95_9FLAO|nr:lytic transglycosylase domain-containing protein [Galbibacter pacificus]MDG3583351.1 LysM peptidoglycan-binding domain-containing protein [Galbibacter pacificus]MDG3586832.1 LysM peptidoglycan-binding domain-containing protein [Galbibacter pacificus]
MKHVCVALLFSAFGSLAFAQQLVPTTQRNDKELEVSSDTTSIVEDDLLKDLDSVTIDGKRYTLQKQTAIYGYADHPQAKKIDSMWLNEFLASGLYDTIYQDITNLDYQPIEYIDLPTDTLKARLAKLNQKTPFNVEYNPSLESVIKMFLKNKREFLTRVMARSKFYFPLFEQQLDNYDIPLEIKYLAVIESALNPKAKSRVGATGIWQFMFPTGKMYGLDVSSYVDERSDPIKSTEAACKYLGKLYEMFGDWDLALAAYNSGPGNVNKAIRRSGGYSNYWNIRPFLPRETAGYVPAFLATMYIMEYAKEHGFNDFASEEGGYYFETDTVHVKKLITFDQISEYLQIDREQVQFFNPSYKLDIIPYIDDEGYALRLPRKAIGRFVANEDTIYSRVAKELEKKEKPLPQLVETSAQIRYRVKSGDYLGKIAEKYGVRVSELKRWNGLRNNNIRVGQRLIIYPKKPIAATTKQAKSRTSQTAQKEYIVRSGDSLWSISRKFPGISIKNIQEWNDISGSKLTPGTKLVLCKC